MSNSEKLSTWRRVVLPSIATFIRLMMGAMLILGGWFWVTRADPGNYLTEAITLMIDANRTVPGYESFLKSVVLPNAGLFAFLVGWGELLSGISILLGFSSRLFAVVVGFQLLNYGLMGGWSSVFFHLLFAAAIVFAVFCSARVTGLDRLLHDKWPKALIW